MLCNMGHGKLVTKHRKKCNSSGIIKCVSQERLTRASSQPRHVSDHKTKRHLKACNKVKEYRLLPIDLERQTETPTFTKIHYSRRSSESSGEKSYNKLCTISHNSPHVPRKSRKKYSRKADNKSNHKSICQEIASSNPNDGILTLRHKYPNLDLLYHEKLSTRLASTSISNTSDTQPSSKITDTPSVKRSCFKHRMSKSKTSSKKRKLHHRPRSRKESQVSKMTDLPLSQDSKTRVCSARLAGGSMLNELSSSDESTHQEDARGASWIVNPGLFANIEAVKISNHVTKTSSHRRYRKIFRGPPRVSTLKRKTSKDNGMSKKLAKTERARLAVEELSKQANALRKEAISPDPVSDTTVGVSTNKSQSAMLADFKKKIKKCKGKENISPTQISLVSYRKIQLKHLPSVSGIPRTYQQLGLPPLQRSPSSENYFPKMAPFLRNDTDTERRRHRKSRSKKTEPASELGHVEVKASPQSVRRRSRRLNSQHKDRDTK